MKIEEIKIYITKIEDGFDNEGNLYLKCKGYNCYKTLSSKGKKRNGLNWFSSIRLYPINEQQYVETKNRLFKQTIDKPKLHILCYDNDLTTNLIGGAIRPILVVNKYDFVFDKLFRKNVLLKGGYNG